MSDSTALMIFILLVCIQIVNILILTWYYSNQIENKIINFNNYNTLLQISTDRYNESKEAKNEP